MRLLLLKKGYLLFSHNSVVEKMEPRFESRKVETQEAARGSRCGPPLVLEILELYSRAMRSSRTVSFQNMHTQSLRQNTYLTYADYHIQII